MSQYTIGAVVRQLQPEFSDLTISKVRYLEDQGLVTPVRTDSGYRKFSADDVRRLRFILTAQRDRYLPLKVIREELDRMSFSGDEDDAGPAAAPAPPPPPVVPASVDLPTPVEARGAHDGEPRRSLRELAEHLGVEPKELRALRDHGLLPEAEPYGAADQRIARWALVLLRDGLEPRHLRMYVQFVDRELALFEQMVGPLLKQRNPDSHRRARLLASDLGESSTRLHGALLSRALEELLQG